MVRFAYGQRPCKHCQKLFVPDAPSVSTCTRICPEVVFFEGNPTGPLTIEERNRLVLQWAGLAWKHAVKMWRSRRPRGMDECDLFQEGILGLMHAAEKYIPNNEWGAGYQTYAWNWVKQFIQRAIETNSLISVPIYVQAAMKTEDPEDIKWRERVRKATVALHPTAFPDDWDITVAKAEPAVESEVADKALSMLKDVDAEIVGRRFGLNGHNETILQAIADDLGISKERVRQREANSLKTLRDWLKDTGDGIEFRSSGEVLHMRQKRQLVEIQQRLSRLFDEFEETGDPKVWRTFEKLERKETDLRRKLGLSKKAG